MSREYKKHAYLIMAHNNFYILDKLLRLLDNPRNDIYLHIDKKVKNFDFDGFRAICQKARVYYPKKRTNVQWGTQSQVLTEMLLYKTAFAQGPYHYYHLISGVDLPLKSQREIHAYFENRTDSLLEFAPTVSRLDVERISRYSNVFSRKHRFGVLMNEYIHLIQEKTNHNRLKNQEITVRKGANWCSLTHEVVGFLLQNEKTIKRFTRFSRCADEIYKQTLIYPAFKEQLDNNYQRMIDWERIDSPGHPHIFDSRDFEQLMSSDKLFARKFDEKIDVGIVDKIYEHIRKSEGC